MSTICVDALISAEQILTCFRQAQLKLLGPFRKMQTDLCLLNATP